MAFHFVLESLTKKELVDLNYFAYRCLSIKEKSQLTDLIERITLFFDYDYSVCGIGEISGQVCSNIVELLNISYPEKWLELYIEKKFIKVDPIFKTHFASFSPQIWSDTYERHSNLDEQFIQLSEDYGLIEGASYGIKDTTGCSGSLFSFSGIKKREENRVLFFISFLTPYLHTALTNCVREQRRQNILSDKNICIALSKREKETLNWVKVGKTNWEISIILNISERTIKFHVDNIKKKLNACTRGYAVAKAIQLEIIHL